MNNPIPAFVSRSVKNRLIFDYSTEPSFFRLSDDANIDAVSEMVEKNPCTEVKDTLHAQLREMLKMRKPASRYGEEELEAAVAAHMQGMTEWR